MYNLNEVITFAKPMGQLVGGVGGSF